MSQVFDNATPNSIDSFKFIPEAADDKKAALSRNLERVKNFVLRLNSHNWSVKAEIESFADTAARWNASIIINFWTDADREMAGLHGQFRFIPSATKLDRVLITVYRKRELELNADGMLEEKHTRITQAVFDKFGSKKNSIHGNDRSWYGDVSINTFDRYMKAIIDHIAKTDERQGFTYKNLMKYREKKLMEIDYNKLRDDVEWITIESNRRFKELFQDDNLSMQMLHSSGVSLSWGLHVCNVPTPRFLNDKYEIKAGATGQFLNVIYELPQMGTIAAALPFKGTFERFPRNFAIGYSVDKKKWHVLYNKMTDLLALFKFHRSENVSSTRWFDTVDEVNDYISKCLTAERFTYDTYMEMLEKNKTSNFLNTISGEN